MQTTLRGPEDFTLDELRELAGNAPKLFDLLDACREWRGCSMDKSWEMVLRVLEAIDNCDGI